jgi:hypothetical protein
MYQPTVVAHSFALKSVHPVFEFPSLRHSFPFIHQKIEFTDMEIRRTLKDFWTIDYTALSKWAGP